jgi:rod shape-determining protein MreC
VNRSTLLSFGIGVGIIGILFLFLMPTQLARTLRRQTLEVIGPIVRATAVPMDWYKGMNTKLTTLDEAQKEVTDLREKVKVLEIQNQLLTDKENENARLREMLGFQAASQYQLLPCRVVSRSPSSWWDSVLVDVGDVNNDTLFQKYHGKYSLGPDQPVVSPRGVVGKTGTVSHSVTEVILLVNENCSISAVVEGTKDHGIVQGQGNFEEGRPRVQLDYLPKDSQAAVGQFVLTSGLGPYFPAGLRLGTITEVPEVKKTYPTFGLYRQAVLEPTADLNQLDELFIVLGPKDAASEAAAHPEQ